MNRTRIAVLGAAAMTPAVALLISVPAVWGVIARADDARTTSTEVASQLGPVVAAAAVAFAVALFFIWHIIYRCGAEGLLRKVLWILAVVLLAPVSQPVYWYTRFFARDSEGRVATA